MTDEQHQPTEPAAEADGTEEVAEVVTDTGGPSLRTALEAILMVVDEPVGEVLLAQVTEKPTDTVLATLHELAAEYDEQERGFQLREVAGGWRFYTRAGAAAYVERFVLDGQQARLTQAALETLAVVAYRQPVSRARVSAVRGVNVDGVMRTLMTRGLVEEAGHDGEGGSTLYRTTTYFLERLGLRDISELPDLAPFLPELDSVDDYTSAGGGA
jgi:segregation and condensation protein B